MGGFTCPHCGGHSAADLEDVHPAIVVVCEHCHEQAVVTVMTPAGYQHIHALKDEIERLRAALADAPDHADIDALQFRINALTAARDRYEAALQIIESGINKVNGLLLHPRAIARDALEGRSPQATNPVAELAEAVSDIITETFAYQRIGNDDYIALPDWFKRIERLEQALDDYRVTLPGDVPTKEKP